MIIGINASNIKSAGGINHIYNLIVSLKKRQINKHFIKKIIIWSSPQAFKALSKIKKSDLVIKKIKYDNLFYNLLWKLFFLNSNLKKNNCDIFFSLDGVVLRKYHTTVVLYQNLIPFNYQEIINYGLSFQTLKNIFTFYLFKISSYYANGFIVLNNYGLKLIQSKIGKFKNYAIIPHGVDNSFFKIKYKKKK